MYPTGYTAVSGLLLVVVLRALQPIAAVCWSTQRSMAPEDM
jgi:hypothetical protein